MLSETSRRWIIAEASEICSRASMAALQHGFDIALTGEVLFTGRGKECNLLLLALPSKIAPSGAAAVHAIAAELQVQHVVAINSMHYQLHVAGKQIAISLRY